MSGLAGTLGLRLPSRRRAKAKAKDKPLEYTLLLTATMCLLTFGVVMVFSASSSASLLDNGDSLFYLKRTLMFGAFGLVALKILSMQRLETLRRLTGPILLGAIGLLLVTEGDGNLRQRGPALARLRPDPDPGLGDRQDRADALRGEPARRAARDDPRPAAGCGPSC